MQRRYMLAAAAIAAAAALIMFLATQPINQILGAAAQMRTAARDETPYGEYLEINLDTSAKTSQLASWLANTASASQNVWTVNGTYRSQALVTLGYSLQVSYANVQNIQIVQLYIKAIDNADSSSYTYTLASGKSLSGASPITDSGSIQKSIATHLGEVAAATSSQIRYNIYCKVQAQGSISGQTLTAEITERWFCTLNYNQQTESTSATVTPSVNVASWVEEGLRTWTAPAVLAGLSLAAVTVLLAPYKKRRGRRR